MVCADARYRSIARSTVWFFVRSAADLSTLTAKLVRLELTGIRLGLSYCLLISVGAAPEVCEIVWMLRVFEFLVPASEFVCNVVRFIKFFVFLELFCVDTT